MRLTDFKVLTFDCYGTLIDWETGILNALRPLLARGVAERSRDEILASFARHETAQEAETPDMIYSELLGQVHRRLAEEWGIAASEAAHRTFGGSVGSWPAFADSAASLAYLGQFYKLVILSNVDRKSFAQSRKRLGVAFDAVYTAEDIGSYKPDLRNFRSMIDALKRSGHAERDILHIAQSLFHDHAPANTVGLRSAWIDRRNGSAGGGATPPPPANVHYDFRFASMAELVEAHRDELRD
jgi:2-haloalkanoic acid dehalogenase type II